MKKVRYTLLSVLLFNIGITTALNTAAAFLIIFYECFAAAFALIILGAVASGFCISRLRMEGNFEARYLPVAIPFLFVLLFAVVVYTAGGSSVTELTSSALFNAYVYILFPFYAIDFMYFFLGRNWLILMTPVIYEGFLLISFIIFERCKKTRVKIHIKSVAILSGILCACIVCQLIAFAYHSSNSTVLPYNYGTKYGNGYSSVDIESYRINSAGCVLPVTESGYTISKNEFPFPRLDGAEAAYPVYSAFAYNCYDGIKNMNRYEIDTYVTFTNTIYAFERLVNGEVDIFFGARPSAQQVGLAADKGKTLVLTPIAKEAFVFFVSKNNPIDSLATEQIKDIYSGKVTNWKELGGNDEKIFAFQRPENSGSQTMLQYIMQGTHIKKPLIEEYVGGMGEIVSEVADYRNNSGSIGYSFRFFLTGMTADADDVKMLKIDGVEPDTANISDGTYPFTTNLYAITIEGNPRVPSEFLEWMCSSPGQEICERIGYVPIN